MWVERVVDTYRNEDDSEGDKPLSATAQRVADILRDRIVRGELAAGERIVERKLSAELEVSRTPVREALKLLQADGLIDISLHRGAQVTSYSAEEAVAIFDVIAVMESLAAQRLAERLSPDVLDRLEDIHSRLRDRFAAADAPGYFPLNTEFHDTIVAHCGNAVLIDSHTRLARRSRRARYLVIMHHNRWARAVGEHDRLMEALRSGDAEAAGGVWLTHLRHTGTSVADIMRHHGL